MIKKIINIIIKKIYNVKKSYSFFLLKNNFEILIKKIFEELLEIIIYFYNYIKIKNCYNKYFLIKEICDFLYYFTIFILLNKINNYEIQKEFYRKNILTGKEEKFNRN